jgi:hypothetical protein
MRYIFPLILILVALIGCGQTEVPFNTKTTISYTDEGVEYKMAIIVDSIRGGIQIQIENQGIEAISLRGESAIYLDANGNELQAVNEFYTRPFSFSTRLMDSYALEAKSGKSNFGGIVPPLNATSIVFKNYDKKKTLFKVALK